MTSMGHISLVGSQRSKEPKTSKIWGHVILTDWKILSSCAICIPNSNNGKGILILNS